MIEDKHLIGQEVANRMLSMPKQERFCFYEQLARNGFFVRITLTSDPTSKDGVAESVFIDLPNEARNV